MSDEGVKVFCQRCGYSWEYLGKKIEKLNSGHPYPLYITCPECHTSVKLTKEVLKK